ncbi:membrane protein [Rhodococcus phage Reynauld]|uniref:Membrane protein n=1 Tax=Rhodococcus phage Reynauld TaxID=3062845 RepID=A0ACD4UHN1_9CAUD|nr:membrane protein [Rhodococcus phage Reynauld]
MNARNIFRVVAETVGALALLAAGAAAILFTVTHAERAWYAVTDAVSVAIGDYDTDAAPLPSACSVVGTDTVWTDDDGAPCGGTGDAPGAHDDTGAAYACETVNVYTWRCTLAAPTTPNN